MSLWGSLLLTGLGGLIATVASLVTAWMQGRNAARARAEQFARDDKYRLYKERIDAYARFHQEISRGRPTLQQLSAEGSDEKRAAATDTRRAIFDACIPIVLIGHREVLTAVWQIYGYIDEILSGEATYEPERWGHLASKYRDAARFALIEQRYLSHDGQTHSADPQEVIGFGHPQDNQATANEER